MRCVGVLLSLGESQRRLASLATSGSVVACLHTPQTFRHVNKLTVY